MISQMIEYWHTKYIIRHSTVAMSRLQPYQLRTENIKEGQGFKITHNGPISYEKETPFSIQSHGKAAAMLLHQYRVYFFLFFRSCSCLLCAPPPPTLTPPRPSSTFTTRTITAPPKISLSTFYNLISQLKLSFQLPQSRLLWSVILVECTWYSTHDYFSVTHCFRVHDIFTSRPRGCFPGTVKFSVPTERRLVTYVFMCLLMYACNMSGSVR